MKYIVNKTNIKNTTMVPQHHEKWPFELIVKIKKFKFDRFGSDGRYMIKCYLSIMGTTNGDQYFLYPWWCEVYSTEFDENDYIPYKSYTGDSHAAMLQGLPAIMLVEWPNRRYMTVGIWS